uniref:Putative udp-glucoronosyl and udp-glucosyl transferase n=1 Tax=Culex tarsalis TaxID=7177 RepID=A0A1Q3FQK2_CULTA
MRLVTATLLVLASLAWLAQGYRILSINASPSRSHVIVQEALAKELARRGHQVTMVSPYPAKPLENYRQIVVPLDSYWKATMAKFMEDQSKMALFKNMPKMNEIMLDAANNTINHPEVQRIIQEEPFDLFITGLMSDFVLGVAYQLGVPSVVVCPNAAMEMVNSMVGNPAPLATVPNPMVGVTNAMTFTNRLKNLLGKVIESGFTWYMQTSSEQYYYSNFPRDQFPSYDEVRRNVSLVLINQYFTKTAARPYVQAMVEVGGLQIKPVPDPLPADLQEWLDEARDGVIFFSMGTNLQSSTIPAEKLQALVSTFGKLKQRIIWKWDSKDIPNKPANILLRSWLPQDDILAHKNVRLFITHGGLGGIAEAQYHGVPLVGMPMFGDQPHNMERVKDEGWALVVPFAELTEPVLTDAVNEVLHNSSYAKKVRELSELYRDRPLSAMDTAVFWTEYVIRHKGARHMRYSGVDLNFVQLNMLDVWAFLGIVVLVSVKVTMWMCLKCCGKRNSKYKMN